MYAVNVWQPCKDAQETYFKRQMQHVNQTMPIQNKT